MMPASGTTAPLMLDRRHADVLAVLLVVSVTILAGLWLGWLVALWLAVMGEPPPWVSKGLVWAVVFGRLAVMIARAILRMWRG
jgi:hypothetical protein